MNLPHANPEFCTIYMSVETTQVLSKHAENCAFIILLYIIINP